MGKNQNKHNSGFFEWFFERILFYIRARKLPRCEWPCRYVWLKTLLVIFLKALKENPIRALKFCPKLFSQENFGKGFILLVFGPKVIKDTLEACETVGVKPFLLFGTLRGFIIQKDFLSKACSGDIDFGLLDKDFSKKHLIKDALLKKGYPFWYETDHTITFKHPEFLYLSFDFCCVYIKNGQAVIIATLVEDQNTHISNYFPLEIFAEFCSTEFQHIKVLVPKDPEKFLLIHYGPDWRNTQIKSQYLYERNYLNLDVVKPNSKN